MTTVFVFAVFAAWSVYATRSLFPAIAAHMLTNVPRPLEWAPYEAILIIPAAILLVWMLSKAAQNAYD